MPLHLTAEDLVRLANAGGGFSLQVENFQPDELVRIATAAAKGSARVTMGGMARLDMDQLLCVARAGRGFLTFEN